MHSVAFITLFEEMNLGLAQTAFKIISNFSKCMCFMHALRESGNSALER